MSATVIGAARGSDAPPPSEKRGGLQRAQRLRNRNALLLIIPTLVLLAIVIGYPIVSAIITSFQKDAGLDPATGFFVQGGFAGFSNFTHWLLQRCPTGDGGTTSCPPGNLGAQFWNSTFTTFFFTVATVVLETVIGFWMAIVMNRAFSGRALVRTAILVPWAIPTAVTAKLWVFMFSVAGIVNALFNSHILWTSDDWPSRFAIIIIDVWKTTPFMALLILAGLQLIPGEVYEAARVDGASTWKTFWTVTLPLVRPALLVAVLFRVLDALRMYDLPAIFGGGNATATWSILVVEQLRQGPNSASALSTIVFVFIFLIAYIFVRFLGANVVQTTQAQQKGELK
ncbi:carbohydrate ABC transporter permease [Gryllotalpicola protaetiae]|uniref:Sugar ABC transporter permease n=1 Tax=Gryllotalpicola protaetiae TaxID=2419771 RepID=A0A387BSI9_9MICO|nr:sugar ABC transporter permease [Gryllotalpicola protaetiae]AYG04029.1 sugar ABC transporter permease [Gryllotalpicola protaetiae]